MNFDLFVDYFPLFLFCFILVDFLTLCLFNCLFDKYKVASLKVIDSDTITINYGCSRCGTFLFGVPHCFCDSEPLTYMKFCPECGSKLKMKKTL